MIDRKIFRISTLIIALCSCISFFAVDCEIYGTNAATAAASPISS